MANKIMKIISGKYTGCVGTVSKGNSNLVYFYPLDEKYPSFIVKHKNEIGYLYDNRRK